ncbi:MULTISPECIES: acetyl-CoA C-acyltransferase [unclassified Flavobacterium]|uniref:acetyl-CoA C-acyltransferase n=1 Tax=unclassified Flavobacterium TaxID=196869 RepID=UPI001F13093C|nr:MULTISPECIES: acetyl-CoA C-acyltransferase [unclassified Flavobacterium]UMY65103.1 acetyl-CoA C-acyltransferase [Flavobacterium sp. HJ-32-4]
MKEVFIVAAKRTPIGGLMGRLSGFSATELGALAIRSALETASVQPDWVDSVYMGNVLSAGIGQSPARQAAIFSGIRHEADATTVNKVCASGLKATALGAMQIQLGIDDLVVTGGMESMSNVPHYAFLRNGTKLGTVTLTDGMIKDGLWDAYHDFHMGSAAELGVTKYGLTRAALDAYAMASYQKAQDASAAGKFRQEMVAVTAHRKKDTVIVDTDEDIHNLIPEKVPTLPPVFEKDGALTAANSSNLNDGAAALLLSSEAAVVQHNLTPLARVVAFADGAQAPEWFTTAPSIAITKALQRAQLSLSDIDYFEINEAYASVVPSNQQLLGFDPGRVNVYGGAVALGHPIGASGARILVTLLHVLQQENGRYGVAAICNGGGGASAFVIERLSNSSHTA